MLETKNIFIDTQYYVKAGLNFQNSSFQKLESLCQDGELVNFTTSVVKEEVNDKVKGTVVEALSIIKNFKRKRHILTAINEDLECNIFDNIDENDIFEKSNAIFENHLDRCSTQIIDASDVDTEEILKLYFNKKSPFSEKKKNEFPDAISLLSLKSALDDKKIYIVSDDSDMKNFCASDTNFISIESLEIVLDLYNKHKHKHRDNIANNIKMYITSEQESIEDKIKEHLKDCEVYNTGWEDSEVTSFDVDNISTIEPNIINLEDNYCLIAFDVDINLNVRVTGPDYNNSMYDREDGYRYVFGTSDRKEVVSKNFRVELELSYEIEAPKLTNIEIIDTTILDCLSGVEVNIEENSPYDYK